LRKSRNKISCQYNTRHKRKGGFTAKFPDHRNPPKLDRINAHSGKAYIYTFARAFQTKNAA
jgi:hypothetical protein